MSLYYHAAPLIVSNDDTDCSLKSRVFSAKDLKSSPKQVYALVVEAAKWSPVLADVLENSQLLKLERKLSPSLALLLVHDLILNKRGIAAPASHTLRLSVERHKARLNAEFTKARLKRGFVSIDALRASLTDPTAAVKHESNVSTEDLACSATRSWPHPRWIRVNTLKTSMDEQLRTTFANYKALDSVEKLLGSPSPGSEEVLYIDKHIPNLIALPAGTELLRAPAYINGCILLQDKASCFPAYLLDPEPKDGACLDACAAPGNKTTHLAAILQSSNSDASNLEVFAIERDKKRAVTLDEMVHKAGAQDHVRIRAGQDFLRIDPQKSPWSGVGSLLLDPSCSGSGIVGRDDTLKVVLPCRVADMVAASGSKKRKRKVKAEPSPVIEEKVEEVFTSEDKPGHQLSFRLESLSHFQLKLLLHAFLFPAARKITYSTCSTYAQENEHVVMKALASSQARECGWRIMRRSEQISGMKAWDIRGNLQDCTNLDIEMSGNVETIAEACIRCNKNTEQGTQGFFVAAFVRDKSWSSGEAPMGDVWEGFSDTASDGQAK